MVFCFVQNFFSDNTRVRIFFYFFSEFNIRLYDKNSKPDYFCFPPPKSEFFFQQHWESEYFFYHRSISVRPVLLVLCRELPPLKEDIFKLQFLTILPICNNLRIFYAKKFKSYYDIKLSLCFSNLQICKIADV